MKNVLRFFLFGLVLTGQMAFTQTEFVSFTQVKQVADQRAATLWGNVNSSEPLAYYTQNDELIGYRFTYAINKQFPDRKLLMQQCREAYTQGDKKAQWGNDDYGTIFVGARKDIAVIQQHSKVLSPEYAVGSVMAEKAKEQIEGEVYLKRAYYVDFQNQWFCYTNGSEDIYVKAFPKLTAVNKTEFHLIVDQLGFFTAKGDFTEEWNKYLTGQMDAPSAAVMIPNHDGNCKYYDWSYGCSPTAAAMLLSYWDYVSSISSANYAKLVDFHFSRYDDIQGEWDYQVPNTNKELAIYMNTDTATGGTDRGDIVPGYNTVCNSINGYNFVNTDYGEESYTTCWNRIVTEVGTNHRPIHISIPGHSECCVGYDAATYEIAVHNTWNEGIDWQTRTNLERVYTIVPAGSEGYSIVMTYPLGDVLYNHNGSGETLYAGDACEIRWSYDYALDSYVKLYYSTNGGGVWYTITTNTPNDGVYDWVIPAGINSSTCRIRAMVYSSGNVFSGADGSTGNFKIYSGGSLYDLSEDSWMNAYADPDYFQFTSTSAYWNVVGVRPNVSGEDWDISLFDDISFSNQLATSAYGGSSVDFVVLDGNHTSSLARGIKLNRFSGSGSGRVEWEGGTDLFTASSPITETWTAGDVVEMWDVWLTPGYYKCTMLVNSGTANLGIALYGSSGAAYYSGRSGYLATADSYGAGLGESFWVNITTTDYYGLCIFANDANTANITVKFETQGQWLGMVSNDWFDPDNWSAASVPTSTVEVKINTGYSYYPIIGSGVANCDTITIGPGAKLSLGAGDLNVAGNMIIHGQVEQTSTSADFYVTGSVLWESGSTANITAGGRFHVETNWEFRDGSAAVMANGYVYFEGTNPYAYLRSYEANSALRNVYNYKTAGYLYFSSASSDTLKINGFYYNTSTGLFYSNTNYPVVLKGQLYNYGHIYCPYGTFIFDGTAHSIDLNTGDYFNNIIISSSGNVTLADSLRMNGDLTINSGSLVAGTYPILIGGNWDNNVGTAGFSEGTGKVVFNGGSYHQYCSTETFNRLEVDKTLGGAFRVNGSNVTCQIYDWTAGAVDVLSGTFTANDLADNAITGSFYLNAGGTINLYNMDGWVDLNGFLYIYGGNFNVYGGNGSDSFWPYTTNAGVTMSGGVLDFKNVGIYVFNTTETLAENITAGTIRTARGFGVNRSDFTPAGGTIEFYGPTDASFYTNNSSYVRNVIVNKSAADNSKPPAYSFIRDRETSTVTDAPLTNTINLAGTADVNGNVTIQSGVLSAGTNTIYVEGNWNNLAGTAGFDEGTGTVLFDGALDADVLSSETFYNLNLNKTYLYFDGLELMQDVTVSNNLYLLDGALELNDPADLTIAGNVTMELNAGLNANDAYGPQVYVGKNWTNANTTYDTEKGFDPGAYATVTFNGTADQILTTACASETFYNLRIDKSAGKFRPNDNIQCNNNMVILNGTWEDNLSGTLHHTFYGDFTVQPSGAFLNAFPLNTVEFKGTQNSVLTYASGTGYFHHLIINKGTGYSVMQVGNTSCQYNGNLTIDNGIYNLNGNNLFVFGDIAVNDLGVLSLPAASLLVLSDTKSMNVNSGGRIEIAGTSGSPVTIRANTSTARYAFNINTGGTIAADYGIFKNMFVNGVYVSPSGIVDLAHAFRGCTFQDGNAGSTLLAINNSQVMTIRNAVFPPNVNGCASNVAKTLGGGHVYFVDYSGSFSGEAFDADGFNLIDWVPTLTASATATPGSVCYSTSSQLNAIPGGGLPGYSYLWSPALGLSNPAISNPVATPSMTTTYYCTVTDALGTTVTASALVTVVPWLPVSVTITASANPSPPGDYVLFTATPVNGGPSPSYQWKVNGVNKGTLPTYSYVPAYNDHVACVVTSNYLCPSGNPATSNTITMIVVAANTSVTGNVPSPLHLCFDASNTVTVAGGGNVFTVQPGASAVMIAGVKISYLYGTTVLPGGYMHGYITTTNGYCGGLPTSMVAVVTGDGDQPAVVLPSGSSFTIYPNPTNGVFTLLNRGETVSGKVKVEIFDMRGDRIITTSYAGATSHVFSLSELSQGLYFVKVTYGEKFESFKLIVTR
ncbi:MAG: T9SS type A sorting domain-containing protein [Bacteroidetes bacterium]|nr:T9SS type A sorting domain-containing protein [Bacteroidota bacterium]